MPSAKAKKMHRSAEPADKISNIRISSIATLDNGTMVEAFKFLNYCQLAKNSLVSKKFRGVIQTHRHKLALLWVRTVNMVSTKIPPAPIEIFDKKLSAKAYNKWAIRNNYSKQIPLESQVATIKKVAKNYQKFPHNKKAVRNIYPLNASAYYKDPSHRKWTDTTSVFFAQVELNHENWPLFQHFARLVTDPFIYIYHLNLTPHNDVLNLLAGAINPDCSRLRCEQFNIYFNANVQKFMDWIKYYMLCQKVDVHAISDDKSNYDKELVDFFLTGACCTREIIVTYHSPTKLIVNLVQKFIDLKTCDEYQLVESVESLRKEGTTNDLKRRYAKFIVKEETEKFDRSTPTIAQIPFTITTQIFEFKNDDIANKLQLTAITTANKFSSHFVLKITYEDL